MAVQLPLPESARSPERVDSAHVREVLPDLAYLRAALVNVTFIGPANSPDRGWVLVDTGVTGTKRAIVAGVKSRFGASSRPAAIIQTHGHFDHVGALQDLSEEWDVPIYAHTLEHPFLTGQQSYPAPDSGAKGGIMPRLAALFPRSPIDVSERLLALPDDGSVPHLPSWQWIHTPGHTPGHISLWRASDRTLVAGDAVITTGQESAYAIAFQKSEMHGPPRYFTPDWVAAGSSVRRLASLEPNLIVTGHGRAMAGPEMLSALHRLADEFEKIALPRSKGSTARRGRS
jgi:glyoxylase-like metal-dependent hydrolase (beta-lactamase superfamily II)